MASNYNRPHINIENRRQSAKFKSTSDRYPSKPPPRDWKQHGALLRKQLTNAVTGFERDRPTDVHVEPTPGVYLELELRPNSNPDEYEKKRRGLKPVAGKTDPSENRVIGLFVPADAQDLLEEILRDYQSFEASGGDNNPPRRRSSSQSKRYDKPASRPFGPMSWTLCQNRQARSFGGKFGV